MNIENVSTIVENYNSSNNSDNNDDNIITDVKESLVVIYIVIGEFDLLYYVSDLFYDRARNVSNFVTIRCVTKAVELSTTPQKKY